MEVYIVVASINTLENIKKFETMLANHNYKIIVVDEGEKTVRRSNDKLLSKMPHIYYGPNERGEWFKQHLGLKYQRYLSVIPQRCHAETSFGFLVAYEEQPDFVIELDDDVFPIQRHNIVDCHLNNLFSKNGITVYSKEKWYNSMENLDLNIAMHLFPRGHPYAREARTEDFIWSDGGGECVLNMGLWAGHPDLDALTILYHGGLDGRCGVKSKESRRNKIIVDKGTYFALCSMNTAFLPRIVPAFYQLYMNFMGVDRFDDIWSGIFFKKIADHLGDKICLGEPIVYHDKRPRDVFKDLKKELEGMIINEALWKMLDEVELDGKTYWDSYYSLAHDLEKKVEKLQNSMRQKFMLAQIKKMKLWLKIIDRIM